MADTKPTKKKAKKKAEPKVDPNQPVRVYDSHGKPTAATKKALKEANINV